MLTHFKKNKNPLQGIFLKIGLVVVLIVVLYLVIVNVKVYKKKQEVNWQLKGLEDKVAVLKSENSNLKEKTLTANDDEYIEKVAREELNLQKPGETVVSFITNEEEKPKNNEEKKGILEVWLTSLMDIFK